MELIHRAKQYDEAARKTAEHQSVNEMRKAEERRMALENEMMSRRHLMDQSAIKEAEEEMAKKAVLIQRFKEVQRATHENLQPETHSGASIKHSPSI